MNRIQDKSMQVVQRLKRKSSSPDDFWEEFESSCEKSGLLSKVPTSMKSILTACGFNNSWAFKEVNDAKICQLESFVETRHRALVNSIDEYKEIKPFEFLPGHRALILGIKTQIMSMEEEKKPHKKSKMVPDENAIKNTLMERLLVLFQEHKDKIKIDWNKTIQKYQTKTADDSVTAQCSVLCPLCDVSRIIRFDTYWKLSNLSKHLRMHKTSQKIQSKKTAMKKMNKENETSSETSSETFELLGIDNDSGDVLLYESQPTEIFVHHDAESTTEI